MSDNGVYPAETPIGASTAGAFGIIWVAAETPGGIVSRATPLPHWRQNLSPVVVSLPQSVQNVSILVSIEYRHDGIHLRESDHEVEDRT
jgi:hypothetical protein